MASPAKITEALPDTLPEDFGEWDGGESPAAEPVGPGRTDSGSNSGSKPNPRPATTQSSIKPAADLLHGAPLPTPAKDYSDDGAFLHRVKSLKPAVERPSEIAPRKSTTATAVADAPAAPARQNTSAGTAPRKAQVAAQTAAMNEADEVLFQTFRSNSTPAEVQKPANKKKWMMIAVAGGVPALLLLLLTIPLFHHTKAAAAQPVAVPQPVTVTTEDQPETTPTSVKPSPVNSTPADKRSDASTKDVADATPAAKDQQDGDAAAPSPVASQMMNDQLNAPTRIQRATSNNDDAPPPASNFAMAGMGGNAAIGNVFGGDKTKVQIAQPTTVRVSAGVAVGLLVQKTAPVYPLIAKTARVSGTVVLQAKISKTGTIEDLHVLSGPVMLRQSAMDAVRTWRYKPYKLNNDPTEIETTINVIFSLAG